jgi:hypothetical protein
MTEQTSASFAASKNSECGLIAGEIKLSFTSLFDGNIWRQFKWLFIKVWVKLVSYHNITVRYINFIFLNTRESFYIYFFFIISVDNFPRPFGFLWWLHVFVFAAQTRKLV